MAVQEYLEIEGGVIRQIQKSVVKEALLEDFFPLVKTSDPFVMPTLPRSAVFAYGDKRPGEGKQLRLLCELSPGIKNLIKIDRRYRLAMPWTYFWFVATQGDLVNVNSPWGLGDYRIFHARERYQNPDSKMIPAILPNVYADGRICFGTTGARANQPVSDHIDQLVNEWYITRFNADLDRDNRAIPYGEKTYRRWVDESRANPNCWLAWPEWNSKVHFTVKTLLDAPIPVDLGAIEIGGRIPSIDPGWTYGRLEQYIQEQLSPSDRGKFKVAMDNFVADHPNDVEMPSTVLQDDGGELIAVGR